MGSLGGGVGGVRHIRYGYMTQANSKSNTTKKSSAEVNSRAVFLKGAACLQGTLAPFRPENPLCPALGVDDDEAGSEGRGEPPTDIGILSEYVKEAREVFGPYGFIVTTHNLHSESYGYESLYHRILGRVDYHRINSIKDLRGGKKRIYLYDIGLIEEKEVYEWFDNMVYRQNNEGAGLINSEGERIISQGGRFCNKKGKRSIKLQKQFKEGIGEISDCILLTLGTHDKEVIQFMPDNTNMLPVQYATVMIGQWITYFLRRLRQFQKNRGLAWEFVGWALEFQQGDEKVHKKNHELMCNGFPHVHMIFRGRWIGNIQEIAKLWPYCEPQGVDYMDKAKYERKLRSQGKLKPGQHVSGIRLINYVTAYVSKCSKAVIAKGDGLKKVVDVHKGYAWLAFCGGRMYNVARTYRKVKDKKVLADLQEEKEVVWKYEGVRGTG